MSCPNKSHLTVCPKTRIFLSLLALTSLVVILTVYYAPFRQKYVSFEKQEFSEAPTSTNDTDIEDKSPTACAFPHLDPFEPNVLKLSGVDKKTLQCSDEYPQVTYVSHNTLKINETKVTEKLGHKTKIYCKYRELHRTKYKDNGFQTKSWSPEFSDEIKLGEDVEFLQVVCRNNQTENSFKMYHALIPEREHLFELYDLKTRKRKQDMAPVETLNVLMIGHDGVSRNQFLRGMKKTYDFLMNDLNSYDLTMYTQQGKNTFPNYLPLLTGRVEEEHNKWWNFSLYTDQFDLIWHEYEKAGYRSLFTEDCPSISAFNYQKKGFMFQPIDYYSRPISFALTGDKDIRNTNGNCVGSQPEQVFHLNYVERLFDTFPNKHLFAFAFFTELTHNDMTNNRKADELLLNFYKSMHSKGHLNNTLLISFSDHGPRWGSIRKTFHGMVESRAPYAVLTFPKWFARKYPNIARNLRINTGRLTAHVDVHATLWDLLYFKSRDSQPQIPKRHGISLFREIPNNRTCENVPIAPEFCLCGQRDMKKIDTGSKLSKSLSNRVLIALRLKADKKLCAELKLERIVQVVKVTLPSVAEKETKGEMLFKVRVQTSPGHAIYEATVKKKGNKVEIGNEIDRMNKYEGQADCISDATKKAFCYCNDLLNG